MKFKLKLALALLVTGSWMSNINAQGCGVAGRPFGNTTLGSYGPYTGMVPATDMFVKTYDFAAPSANNSGTCTEGAPDNTFPTLAGNRGINLSWSRACNTGCLTGVDGGTREVGLVSNQVGAGTAGHDGQFVISSVFFFLAANKWNLDTITNGNGGTAGCPGGIACQVRPISIPTVAMSTDPAAGSTYNHTTGTGLVRYTFTQPAINGFFATTAPTSPVITGYEIHQINVPDTACNVTPGALPTATTLAGWGASIGTLANTDCAAGSCTKLIATTVPACNRARFALALQAGGSGAGTFTTNFVSANSPSGLAGPTGTSGLPNKVEVFNQTTGRIPGVQVRWTTTNESNIAGFNILASRTSGGTYKQMNDSQISAAGSPNTYLQTISSRTFVTALGRGDTYYLKLVTVLKDGTSQEVGPTSFALPSPEPRDRTGKTGGRGN